MSENNEIAILAPANGKVIALSKTSDPIFSKGAMGQGFGLTPSDGEVVAPVSGKVSMIADTKHAVGITTDDGLEVLVHMGVYTVGLKGEPFEILIKDGQTVEAGQDIATMDLKFINDKGLDTTIMVLITNSNDKLDGLDVSEGPAKTGDVVGTCILKNCKRKSKFR